MFVHGHPRREGMSIPQGIPMEMKQRFRAIKSASEALLHWIPISGNAELRDVVPLVPVDDPGDIRPVVEGPIAEGALTASVALAMALRSAACHAPPGCMAMLSSTMWLPVVR
jgi:hypothetical protein